MLAVISSALVVQVQGKVCHLLLVSQKCQGGASLPNDHRELVAVIGIGPAAVALLVEVAKGQAQAIKQA